MTSAGFFATSPFTAETVPETGDRSRIGGSDRDQIPFDAEPDVIAEIVMEILGDAKTSVVRH